MMSLGFVGIIYIYCVTVTFALFNNFVNVSIEFARILLVRVQEPGDQSG